MRVWRHTEANSKASWENVSFPHASVFPSSSRVTFQSLRPIVTIRRRMFEIARTASTPTWLEGRTRQENNFKQRIESRRRISSRSTAPFSSSSSSSSSSPFSSSSLSSSSSPFFFSSFEPRWWLFWSWPYSTPARRHAHLKAVSAQSLPRFGYASTWADQATSSRTKSSTNRISFSCMWDWVLTVLKNNEEERPPCSPTMCTPVSRTLEELRGPAMSCWEEVAVGWSDSFHALFHLPLDRCPPPEQSRSKSSFVSESFPSSRAHTGTRGRHAKRITWRDPSGVLEIICLLIWERKRSGSSSASSSSNISTTRLAAWDKSKEKLREWPLLLLEADEWFRLWCWEGEAEEEEGGNPPPIVNEEEASSTLPPTDTEGAKEVKRRARRRLMWWSSCGLLSAIHNKQWWRTSDIGIEQPAFSVAKSLFWTSTISPRIAVDMRRTHFDTSTRRGVRSRISWLGIRTKLGTGVGSSLSSSCFSVLEWVSFFRLFLLFVLFVLSFSLFRL